MIYDTDIENNIYPTYLKLISYKHNVVPNAIVLRVINSLRPSDAYMRR